MIVRAEAFLRKLRRAFSRSEWMARLLNLPKVDASSASGPALIMIQIDGLGLTQFERAMKKGHMPFLSWLLKKESYTNYRHYTGLPSNTPAVQGALFYGVKSCVPSFSFRDRSTGHVCNMFSPAFASSVEGHLKEGGVSLLEGGSAYGNIFTGGAGEAHFCASSMGWGSLLKAANPWGIFVTLVLNINIFIRAFFLVITEFFLSIFDSFRGFISGRNLFKEIGFIPLRVAICVGLREAVEMGVKIDIARGLPVIHANFAGYDEQAHHRGPTSSFAHWSLGGIDAAIRRIWKAAKSSGKHDYDVFIYSDHGQEETVDYPSENGRSIQEAVAAVFEEKILSDQWHDSFHESAPYWRAHLLREKKSPKIISSIIPEVENKDGPEAPKAIVSAMGPVGLVYLPNPLTADEEDRFAKGLIDLAKVPFVMAKSGEGKAYAWNSKGKFILPEEAENVIEKDHPFFDEVSKDLVDLCHHPDAGTFLMFGWRKGARSLTFQKGERGSHAGPGPHETSGFALLPFDTFLRQYKDKKVITTEELRKAALLLLGHPSEEVLSAKRNLTELSSPLRVMTYNVHGCLGRDGRTSPARIARIIARHNPDIVALQELDAYSQKHQAEIIAEKLAMNFEFIPVFSMKKGVRGNAIFSRFPMKVVRSGFLPRIMNSRLLEPRGALWVEVDIQGRKVQVVNTHLSLSSTEGLMQIKALLGPDWIGDPTEEKPFIFCGDLNALPQSRICQSIGSKLKNVQFELIGHRLLKTLPSFRPIGLVDHIFVGPGLNTLRIEVPLMRLERTASDHLPVIAEFELTSLSLKKENDHGK